LIPLEQLKKYQAELKNPEKLAGIFQVRRPAMAIAITNFLGRQGVLGGQKKTLSDQGYMGSVPLFRMAIEFIEGRIHG
jgi:hypothetical protein